MEEWVVGDGEKRESKAYLVWVQVPVAVSYRLSADGYCHKWEI